MSRLRVFRQTGWFIAGLMTGLPATAAPAEASSMAGVAVAVATTTPPDATATLQAMQSCRRESAALERLDCYDHLLAPLSPSGFDGALVKAGFVGEAWTRATEQEKRREGNTTELLVTQVPGERPTVVITTPAIGHVPPRPVLMFSCVDNITRMQVALMHPLDVHDIAVTLNADSRALRSHWFVRENGTLLESSRGLSGIDEIKLTLIGTSGNAPRSISFSGPWAQFRLFGAGQLTGVQDGNFTVRFSVDGGAMTYRVHTDTEDNPFSGGLFSQFGLSDTLY
ncbi:type VI secretion system-associated protein VasI [Escherichia coli]|uniref:type VI secretion system-associated protein VasI n=1 Tax=Escherichia coli TaxID=562 RepID=UPI00098CE08B|nr:type VI secretion system-associated protein VasI [Escherichia coli]